MINISTHANPSSVKFKDADPDTITVLWAVKISKGFVFRDPQIVAVVEQFNGSIFRPGDFGTLRDAIGEHLGRAFAIDFLTEENAREAKVALEKLRHKCEIEKIA